ncbi:DUF1566 domain-containing protein [uncultured Stenotrophomonas sp.]|uniref:Lcl C-terminal domain-containing protein n=1 Tax=uncultured Stenotrophomonas sp. TaxID=165438 RepID=UPI0025ECF492|nr:DUF1566 domain-containing protein [uncultured Stenotrophomonas sp.]
MNDITISTATADIVIRPREPAMTLLAVDGFAAAPQASGFTKVLADGTHLPAGSSLTNHVAVIDHSTGLMWCVESLGSKEDADDGITQEACEARCRELSLLSVNDWRLPTRAELAALVDDARHEPAIDTSLFPRVKPRWHWTSTPCAWSSASAWFVNFSSGNVSNGLRSYSGFALAVRRAGQ